MSRQSSFLHCLFWSRSNRPDQRWLPVHSPQFSSPSRDVLALQLLLVHFTLSYFCLFVTLLSRTSYFEVTLLLLFCVFWSFSDWVLYCIFGIIFFLLLPSSFTTENKNIIYGVVLSLLELYFPRIDCSPRDCCLHWTVPQYWEHGFLHGFWMLGLLHFFSFFIFC